MNLDALSPRSLASFNIPGNQNDRFAFQLFPEMLIPSQFPALVPSQQSDDAVLNTSTSQGRASKMAKIMEAQRIGACKLRHPTKPLPEIPGMRSIEIALEPWVWFRWEDILVAIVARESAESVNGHVGYGLRDLSVTPDGASCTLV